jgi:DNA-binding beta-propeller fold protein YncE
MSMAVAMSLTAAAISQTPGSPPAPYTRSVTQNGTNVTVTISPVDPAGAAAPGLQELENVLVRVKLTDASTGSPLPGALPAAWVDSHPAAGPTTQQQCVGEVKRFAEGSTFSHSQLDLTSFYVVLLNSDATLTVVDPRFGYGDTRLLAMVTLDGPAEDWALTENAERILISVPVSGKLLAVDTASWKIVAEASGIPKAARVVLQPDEAYVWVAYSGQGQDSGVTAIDARTLRVVAHIRTGAGYHHIAFSEDSSLAFVSNPDDGTVSIVVAAVGLRDGKAERGYGHRAGAQPVADVLAQAARRHGSHAEHRA